MNKIQLSILFLLVATLLNGQADTAMLNKFLSLESSFVEFKDSISNEFAESKMLLEKKDNKIYDLERKMDMATSIISGLNIALVILSIFFGAIGVGVPIFTYLWSYKPAKELIDNVEIHIDVKVANYLKVEREKRISKAIKNLKDGDKTVKEDAIHILWLDVPGGFSDIQISEICQIIDSDSFDTSCMLLLLRIVSIRVNSITTTLFSKTKYLSDRYTQGFTLKYMCKAGVSEFTDTLSRYLEDESKHTGGLTPFLKLVRDVNNESKPSARFLLNDSKIVNALRDNEIINMGWNKGRLSEFLEHLDLKSEAFDGLYVGKRIKELEGKLNRGEIDNNGKKIDKK